MTQPVDRSYRALLRVPTLARVLLSMQIARVAQSMVGVALVLFTLDRFDSPAFAGLVTFASIFPGLLISPVAGALLDRHGRIRLVLLDYVVALAAMGVIGALALLDLLPGPVLLMIAVVSSLTSILSHVGLRSLFPILVPEPLWERVNAVDSNGYVVATILGPPIAALLVALLGGATALVVIVSAFVFGRMDTRGREWSLLVWPMVALVPTVAILLVAAGQAPLPVGLSLLFLEMFLVGLLIGPMDIALFTVRQRRTDPAWMGRAFAVSMAFNYVGMPIGAALAGLLADGSIEAAIIVLGIGGSMLAAAAAAFLVPRTDPALTAD